MRNEPYGCYVSGENGSKWTDDCFILPFCGAEYHDCYDGYIDAEDFNYCPNCGAMMDGERRDLRTIQMKTEKRTKREVTQNDKGYRNDK